MFNSALTNPFLKFLMIPHMLINLLLFIQCPLPLFLLQPSPKESLNKSPLLRKYRSIIQILQCLNTINQLFSIIPDILNYRIILEIQYS